MSLYTLHNFRAIKFPNKYTETTSAMGHCVRLVLLIPKVLVHNFVPMVNNEKNVGLLILIALALNATQKTSAV